MGKQNYRNKLIENGRLSGLKSQQTRSTLASASASTFANSKSAVLSRISGQRFDNRVDARLKLQVKNKQSGLVSKSALISSSKMARISDARQLLLNKKKKELVTDEYTKEKISGRFQDSNKKNHIVRTDGINTLVTLKNDLANTLRNRQPEVILADLDTDNFTNSRNGSSGILEVDRTRNGSSMTNKNELYQPIRIKIDNNLTRYSASNSDYENPIENGNQRRESASNYSFHSRSENMSSNRNHSNSRNSSSHYHGDYYESRVSNNSNNRNDDYVESMDVEYDNQYNSKSRQNNISNNFDSSYSASNSGHRLLISNLHPRVTEDDVLELFSDVGPIKRARFLEKGLAEVIYVKLEHAKEAIYKYDKNELDGRIMNIELISNSRPTSEIIAEKKLNSSVPIKNRSKSPIRSSSSLYTSQKQSSSTMSAQAAFASSGSKTFSNISSSTPAHSTPLAKDSLSNRFKSTGLNNDPTINLPDSKKSEYNKINVDTSIIHQVLFNKKQNTNARPVTFTVKL